jgi:hypothetical protein
MIVVDVMVPTIDGSDFGRFWVDRELWVSLMCRILSRKKKSLGVWQPVNPSHFKVNSRVPWCFESRSPLFTLIRFQVNGKNARFFHGFGTSQSE